MLPDFGCFLIVMSLHWQRLPLPTTRSIPHEPSIPQTYKCNMATHTFVVFRDEPSKPLSNAVKTGVLLSPLTHCIANGCHQNIPQCLFIYFHRPCIPVPHSAFVQCQSMPITTPFHHCPVKLPCSFMPLQSHHPFVSSKGTPACHLPPQLYMIVPEVRPSCGHSEDNSLVIALFLVVFAHSRSCSHSQLGLWSLPLSFFPLPLWWWDYSLPSDSQDSTSVQHHDKHPLMCYDPRVGDLCCEREHPTLPARLY